MNIDISRVNLLEKDIEDWLYENPQVLSEKYKDNPIVHWIGRQYQLPSGIADLIGVRQDRKLVVVEIKNVPINKAAILQVCRYTDNVKYIVTNRMDYPYTRDWNEPIVEMIVVGPSIDSQTFCEAQAVGVRIFQFSAALSLNVASMSWNNDYHHTVSNQCDAIASKPEWDIFGLTIGQDFDQQRRERAAKASANIPNDQEDDDSEMIIRSPHSGEDYSDIILMDYTEE